ncbi:MAG TPA: hypothetical protein VGF03_22800 [Bryobacteraceae bacterium]|jgi:hypothetical protein
MKFGHPRSRWSRLSSVLWRGAALVSAAVLTTVGFAQEVQPDTIPVKNWPVPRLSDQAPGG